MVVLVGTCGYICCTSVCGTCMLEAQGRKVGVSGSPRKPSCRTLIAQEIKCTIAFLSLHFLLSTNGTGFNWQIPKCRSEQKAPPQGSKS
jgi:hypothetical protein